MTIDRKTIGHFIPSGFIIMMVLVGCQQEINVPSHFIGEWRTASPKYKDRFIEFTQKELSFGLSEDQKTTHIIKKIKVERKGAFNLYSFYYQDTEGEPWNFSIIHNPHYNDGVFQLKNGQEVWKRGS